MTLQVWGAMACALLIMIGIVSTYFLGNDNEVEEICEKGIDSISGIKVDLSGKDESIK